MASSRLGLVFMASSGGACKSFCPALSEMGLSIPVKSALGRKVLVVASSSFVLVSGWLPVALTGVAVLVES